MNKPNVCKYTMYTWILWVILLYIKTIKKIIANIDSQGSKGNFRKMLNVPFCTCLNLPVTDGTFDFAANGENSVAQMQKNGGRGPPQK